jgi:hypothetical protein
LLDPRVRDAIAANVALAMPSQGFHRILQRFSAGMRDLSSRRRR